MLQNKDIAKTQEIKTLFKDTWMQPEFLVEHLELLNFNKNSKLFKSVKKCGVPSYVCKRKIYSKLMFYNLDIHGLLKFNHKGRNRNSISPLDNI